MHYCRKFAFRGESVFLIQNRQTIFSYIKKITICINNSVGSFRPHSNFLIKKKKENWMKDKTEISLENLPSEIQKQILDLLRQGFKSII